MQTLSMFRLVCKNTYNLIKNPYFGTSISKAEWVVDTLDWQIRGLEWSELTAIYKHIQDKLDCSHREAWDLRATQLVQRDFNFNDFNLRLIHDTPFELRFLIYTTHQGLNITMKSRSHNLDNVKHTSGFQSIRFGYRNYEPRRYPNGEKSDHDHHYVVENHEGEDSFEFLIVEAAHYIRTVGLHIDTKNTKNYITYGESLGEHLTEMCRLLGTDKTNRIFLLEMILNLCSLGKYGHIPNYICDFSNKIIGEYANTVIKKNIGNVWCLGSDRDPVKWLNGDYKDLAWDDAQVYMDEQYEEDDSETGSEDGIDDETGPVMYTRKDRPLSKFARY